MRRWGWIIGLALAVGACAGPSSEPASPAATGDPATESPSEWSGNTRHVPADYPTIQAAVDAADPGDLVLIDRGVYKESVSVGTPGLTLRGVDRNEVIIDGEFERANGVQVLFTDGVVVENMTSRTNTITRTYRGFSSAIEYATQLRTIAKQPKPKVM